MQEMQEARVQSLGQEYTLGNGTHSIPENSMGRGAWRATVHGATKSNMTELLHCIYTLLSHISFNFSFSKSLFSQRW